MTMVFRNIERARKEVAQLHGELLRLENGVNLVRESLGKAITELFGTDRQAFPALRESALAARVAEAVLSRLPGPAQGATARKQFVREREAASYMGVSVATLRRWRTLRSNSGPAFTRLGRMVMYSMTELEDHMRAGLVPRRSP
jgi:predicted DNA-binding transcriptional regulator AlpA